MLLTGLAGLLLDFFGKYVLPLIAHEYALRRESDPAYRAESDAAYGALKNATTTAEREAAADKLYELQKNASKSS